MLRYMLILATMYALGIFIMLNMEWGEVCSPVSVAIVLGAMLLSYIHERSMKLAKSKLKVDEHALALLNVSVLSVIYTFGAILLLENTGKPWIVALFMLYGAYDTYANLRSIFEA